MMSCLDLKRPRLGDAAHAERRGASRHRLTFGSARWLVPLVFVLWGVVPTGAQSRDSFTVKGHFPTGSQRPTSIAVGDIDNDGNLDLAVAHFGTGTNGNGAIMWGDGSGAFSQVDIWHGGITNRGALIADFDGDGNLDVVFGDQNANRLVLFWGTAARTPGIPVDLVRANAGNAEVASADIDLDGRLDIVVVSELTGSIDVFFNEGNRTFSRSTFPAGAQAHGIAIGSFDGQHGLDVFITSFWGGTTTTLISNGLRSFGAPTSQPGGVMPHSAATGELTGDAFVDVAYVRRGCFVDATTTCTNDGLTVLAGAGNGTFTPYQDFDLGEGPTDLQIGDLDGDGRAEIVVVNFNSNDVSIVWGEPGGGLVDGGRIAIDLGPRAIALGDFNNDGSLDIAAANWRGNSVSILLNPYEGPPDTSDTTDVLLSYRGRASRIADNRLPRNWVIEVNDGILSDADPDDPENYEVRKPEGILNPADVPDNAAAAPNRHYVRHTIREAREGVGGILLSGRIPRAKRHARRTWDLENTLGTIAVSSRKVAALLVSSAVDRVSPSPTPPDAAHYVCYRTVLPREADSEQAPQGRFRGDQQIFVADAFADCALDRSDAVSFDGTAAAGMCLFDLRAPNLLCNPAATSPTDPPRETSADGVSGSAARTVDSLLCYPARLASEIANTDTAARLGGLVGDRILPAQVRHTKHLIARDTALYVTGGDGFVRPTRMDTSRVDSVCVPTKVLDVRGR